MVTIVVVILEKLALVFIYFRIADLCVFGFFAGMSGVYILNALMINHIFIAKYRIDLMTVYSCYRSQSDRAWVIG